ncbi:MAG: hypothetical protein ACKOXB_13755 [Flavobacteriales bacterium]
MITVVLLVLGLAAFVVKSVIDAYSYMALLSKDELLLQAENKKEKEYEFIKGMY